jgi:cytochrome c-type biogenesis protein CcmE
MTTGRKLAIAGLVVAGVTGYMAYLGAAASWQYYLTVDECLAGAAGPNRVRVSGKIAAGSLRRQPDRRQVCFSLEGTGGNLPVNCVGAIPDNLAERMDVVVEGRLEAAGSLRGEKVLTRCASKYKSQNTSSPARGAARGGF